MSQFTNTEIGSNFGGMSGVSAGIGFVSGAISGGTAGVLYHGFRSGIQLYQNALLTDTFDAVVNAFIRSSWNVLGLEIATSFLYGVLFETWISSDSSFGENIRCEP